MSTFWLIYWIALGIIVIFSGFVVLFFDMQVRYNETKPVPLAYILFAILLGLIPGVGVLAALALLIALTAGIVGGDLVPKKNPFGEKDEDE